jgi:hypothetical protein
MQAWPRLRRPRHPRAASHRGLSSMGRDGAAQTVPDSVLENAFLVAMTDWVMRRTGLSEVGSRTNVPNGIRSEDSAHRDHGPLEIALRLGPRWYLEKRDPEKGSVG